MIWLINVDRRRAIFALCAFVAAPLIFTQGNLVEMFVLSDHTVILAWSVAISSAVCAWLFAPRTFVGTRKDVVRGIIAGLLTALVTPLLFGLGVGLYTFVTTLEVSGFGGSLIVSLYIPIMFFAGSILFFGLFSFPAAAFIGGMVYSPMFRGKGNLPPD